MFSIKILIRNFMKIRPVGAALIHMRTDRRRVPAKVNRSFSRLCKHVYSSSLYFRKDYNFGTEMTAFVSCHMFECVTFIQGADKSLARPTSRCILFDVENISFDVSLVIYINSINIPPIMIINRTYENQNLLSL
jgi:hypothetical protein